MALQQSIRNMRHVSKFKNNHKFEDRIAESSRIRLKYPDRIPVICEKSSDSRVAVIDKSKYLVPADLTIGQFIYVIRRRLALPPEQAIFMFIGETIPPSTSLISDTYNEHADLDGFLYATYTDENTFG